MEQFYVNFKQLNDEQKRNKLDQILMFLRQQNAINEAEAFQDLKSCYPREFPLHPNERQFREHIAWTNLAQFQKHPVVNHIFTQG